MRRGGAGMLKGFVEQLREFLSVALPDICFVADFSKGQKETPLKKITVSIGVNSAEFSEAALGGILGCGDLCQESKLGRLLKTEIGFKIFAPLAFEGADCYDAFSRIVERLYFRGGADFSVESVFCRGISYDRVNAAKVLDAGVVLSMCAEM